VGNITLGGAEKTPLAMEIISFFLEQGIKPAFISRGYKGSWERKGGLLSEGTKLCGTWKESGDEPFMVGQNFPGVGIFIGKNRLRSCRRARQLGFELAVLDDGFQHRRLERDLDIVLHHPEMRWALREQVSALARADIILLRKGESAGEVQRRFPRVEIFEYTVVAQGFMSWDRKEMAPLNYLREKKVMAFCGIARPERFISTLREIGIAAPIFLKFPDHCAYPSRVQKKILRAAREGKPQAVVTTEKDAFKVLPLARHLPGIPLYFLKIRLRVDDEFFPKVKARLESLNAR
jgi:tetraacyldisaccharide 4'-kinase